MLHQTLSFFLILGSCVASHQSPQAAKPKSKVQVLGDFTRLSHPGDDAFGYSLQLWKRGDHIFGLLAVYVGPPADPPTGLLEDVTFDPRTRRFSFSARLSTGFVHASGDKWVPTQDRFTFKGTLTRTAVTGTLQQFDVFRSDEPPLSRQIKLRLARHLSKDLMPAPASYEEWRKWANQLLQRRGPKGSINKSVSPNAMKPVASVSLKKPTAPLYFIDTKTGWAIANNNLYATPDGGTSWKKLNHRALTNCDKVVFVSPNVGWLLCDQWTTRRRSVKTSGTSVAVGNRCRTQLG